MATEKTLPFVPLTPNDESLAAMQELENDELKSFETVEELFEDLNAQYQASWKVKTKLQNKSTGSSISSSFSCLY